MPSPSCPPLACPLCHESLLRESNSYRCHHNHQFDIARQGHVNLLPVQDKRSRDPGDSKEMIRARQRFLDAGYYQPLSDKLAEIVARHYPTDEPMTLFDAGCGEGYYPQQLLPHLAPGSCVIGMDISKWAVQAATQRSREIHWLVGTNRKPPLLPQSVDLLLCLFGFTQWGAFRQLLKPGGLILLADSGPEHLLELRQVIYPEVRHKPVAELKGLEQRGLHKVADYRLTYQTPTLPQPHLADLLAMTPHLYRAPAEGKQAAGELTQLALTVDVHFRLLAITDQLEECE